MTNKKSTLRKLKKIALITVLLIFTVIVSLELTFSSSKKGFGYGSINFLVKELPYRLWLTYEMHSNLDLVKEAMLSFLEKKYNRDFVIKEKGIGSSSISMYYWAKAYLKDNPKINFKINSIYFSLTKQNYKKEDSCNFFYDGFYSAIRDNQVFDLFKHLKKLHSPHDIRLILEFIRGNKDDLKTLNLLKIKDKTKIPKLISDIYLDLGFFIDLKNFDKEKETKLLVSILNKHFRQFKIGRYVVVCRYFPKSLKWEIKRKWRAINFASHPRESIESYYQDGHLINAFILFNFDTAAKELKPEDILNSFIYKQSH